MATPSVKIFVLANGFRHLVQFHLSLLRHLKAQGHELVAAAAADDALIHYQGSAIGRSITLRHLQPHGCQPWRELLLLTEIWQHLRREQPHLLLTFTVKPNIYGALAAQVLGIPVLPTLTGLGYAFTHCTWLQPLVATAYRLVFARLPKVVFQNADDRELFLSRGLLRPNQAVLIRGAGVDTTHFVATPPPVPPAPPVFLFLGRFLGDKGLRELAAAMREVRTQLPTASCWVAGTFEPHYRGHIRPNELARWEAEGLIVNCGFHADVRPLLAAATALVLPSYREGLSQALLEALAMGRPVVTTIVPGCREGVRDGVNGFLVPSRNAPALAAALLRLATLDPAARQAMGAASRRRAETEFALPLILAAYHSHINAMLPNLSSPLAPRMEYQPSTL